MTSRVEIARLTPAQNRDYTARAILSAEISALEKRVATLKTERSALDEKVLAVFGDGEVEYRRWKNNDGEIVILERRIVTVAETIVTPDMVGNVLRKGYSFPKFSVVADD